MLWGLIDQPACIVREVTGGAVRQERVVVLLCTKAPAVAAVLLAIATLDIY